MIEFHPSSAAASASAESTTMRLAPLALAFAFTTLLAPRARAAGSFAADLPPQVRAGQEITLRWSDLPPAVDEVEILLSLDGGRSFAMRVSPELDQRSGVYRWRVPDVEAEHVVLRLRMGTREAELPGPISRSFRIGRAGEAEAWNAMTAIRRVAGYSELPSWSDVAISVARPSTLYPPTSEIRAREPGMSPSPPDPITLDAPPAGAGAALAACERCAAPPAPLTRLTPRHLPLRV